MSDADRVEFLAKKYFMSDNEKVAVYVAGRRRGKTSALCELIAQRVIGLDAFISGWERERHGGERLGLVAQKSVTIVAINATYGLSREFFRQMSDTLKAKKVEQVVAWNRYDHILAGKGRHLIRMVEPGYAFDNFMGSSKSERLDMIAIDNFGIMTGQISLWSWANTRLSQDDCFVRITTCPSHREDDPVNHMVNPGSPMNPKITAKPHIDLPSMSEIVWRVAARSVANEN